ncbi:hypothetical protein [Streptomyces sp. NPDC091371]|uniref:hypothetical protein n=1 Tax=Streptomyces sp. NPDC091371 TaxID=3155303 RepID=UPI00344151F4
MDERGAVVPWHVLEGVSAGQERVPGLLRDLAVPGLRRSSWAKLEELLGWRTDEPLFIEVAKRLFELAPRLDARRRALVLELLARRANGVCWTSVGVHRPAFLAFTTRGHHVVPLVPDPSAEVRTRAAWLLRALRVEDPAALEALRQQAAVESDRTALVSQLLAVAAVSGAADRAATVEWLRPRLDHGHVQVRLAAARSMLLLATPDGVRGTGHRLAEAFAEIGDGPLPEVPWWPHDHTPVRRFADGLTAHPGEAAALVDGLARHPSPRLRAEAVMEAGKQLRYWRDPSPGLWATIGAGLEDEAAEVAAAAVDVLAGAGSAAAPYADRIVAVTERASSVTVGRYAALRALVGIEDPRAPSLYLDHFDNHFLEVARLPAHWAPDVLPAFRERLTHGPEARGVDKILLILTQWGPAAAPAVPELAGLLDTPYARAAAEALGRIGPPASATAGTLAALARGDRSPWRFAAGIERSPKPWHGLQTAAWAYWRVTGDPEPALRAGGSAAQAGPGRPVLRYLADLGPLAAPYADAVRALLGSVGEWTRVGAAEAWWRITGDPAPAVEALLPELAPLAEHRVTGLTLRSVHALTEIGPPAASALPALRTVTAAPPRRYGASFLLDEELCRAAREAVDRIAGPGNPPPS